MKILLTGGAGFIGSHIAEAFAKEGHELIIVDDLSTGKKENLHPRATFYRADVTGPDMEKIIVRHRPEVICHQAAQVNARYSLDHPLEDARTNVLGTVNLLKAAQKTDLRLFVFASSAAVYADKAPAAKKESSLIGPANAYGLAKHTAENYIRYFGQLYGLPYVILRYGNVFGPRQDPFGEAGVCAVFFQALKTGQRPVIFGDGKQTRDFIYVKDVARANLLALGARPGQTVNIGSGQPTTVLRLFQEIKKAAGKKTAPVCRPARHGEIKNIHLLTGRAGRALHWRPRYSLARGLKETASFFGFGR